MLNNLILYSEFVVKYAAIPLEIGQQIKKCLNLNKFEYGFLYGQSVNFGHSFDLSQKF